MDFQDRVIEYVQAIPSGKVATYGQIARACGSASAARQVGYIMNRCKDRDDVPCHRVVNRKGFLTGRMHFGHPHEMENRLLAEDVEFEEVSDDLIKVNLEKHLWDGEIE